MKPGPALGQPPRLRTLWWIACAAIGGFAITARAAEPRIEFATSGASGRSVNPLRLHVDTAGPARRSPLEFELPAGARFVIPPPATVPEGEGAPAIVILHLLVLPEAPAGELELRGSLGGRPLEARLGVRALPDFRVLGVPTETLVGFGGEGVTAGLVVRNRGNTALTFTVSAQTGNEGPRVTFDADTFDLPAGGERKVTVSMLAPERSRVATEHTVAVLIEGRASGFARSDPVIITMLFVPENPKPGPLFAVLSGNVEGGFHHEDGESVFATQIRVTGEIAPGVTLEAHALDGDQSVLGSQLELAGRDTWHVSLEASGWHATAGEARAPSLGFLAPGVFGRGGVAGVRNAAWSADLFALRDHFASSVREAAGFRVAGPGESWEGGVIVQRSSYISVGDEKRAGGFGGLHWMWRGIKGHSELAVAGVKGGSATLGLAQSLNYDGERARIDARIEHAGPGFFLQDESSELQSVRTEWITGRGWTLLAGALRSDQTGKLRRLLEDLDNTGGPDDPPAIIELINEVATRQRTYSAGARREFASGTLRAEFKRQERTGELDTLSKFVEDAFETEWTSRPADPWWRIGITAGRETGTGSSAEFAELNGSAFWSPTNWSRLEGNVRWTSALSGEPRGFRREGVHGEIAGSVTPAKGWKAEVRVEGYDYSDFAPRTRIMTLLRFPIGRSGWSGALEWGRDTSNGDESAWLVVRAPFSIQMPWRPVRGSVSGRVTDAATGSGLPHVLVRSGRLRAMSDASGRYQLPAMEPGRHEIEFQNPGGWTRPATTPNSVDVVAGKKDSLDVDFVELGTLHGEIVVIDPSGRPRAVPAGVVVAKGADGDEHESLAFRGAFTMRLPPGSYQLRFVSELPEVVSRQLTGSVTVGSNEPASVRLVAREKARGIRRTLVPSGGTQGGRK